jgi:NAD(P)-dependent dehydrogenase (short-subunit alcohol dehydrogenase family)
MGLPPPDARLYGQKDDLEHLLPIGFERGNHVVRPPLRLMPNRPRHVVLITGASSGIGRATAELLAARGHRDGVRAAATTRPLTDVELVPLDVRDEASVMACVEVVRSRAGSIDVLVNNDGVNLVGADKETSISQAEALFDTNVIGVLRMIQAALPVIRSQGAGLIINISSIPGLIPAPFMGVYAAKHAIEGLSESLDHEVRAFGICVTLIEPPYIWTSDRRLCATTAPHGGTDYPQHEHGARRVVAEEVLRSIEGPYRMRRPIGQAVLLSWLRRLLPTRLFDPACARRSCLTHRARPPASRNRTLNPEGRATCSTSSAWSSRRP